jgi:hypothetical protein
MTGKLIKHDLKSGARRMGNIYLVAFIASMAMIFSSIAETGIFMKFLSSAAVVVVAAVAVIVTFGSIIFGTNKSLFGREGYLTHTLPVRTSSLIFSKWVASSIWLIISYAFCLVAVFAVFVYWTSANEQGAEFFDLIYSFLQSFGIGAEAVVKKYVIVSALIALFNACILVMFIMFAITLSNIKPFHKLGIIGVILYLTVTILVIQGISNGLADLCDITMIIDTAGTSMTVSKEAVMQASMQGAMTIGFTSVYFKTIATVFLYIITVQLTESKINLK